MWLLAPKLPWFGSQFSLLAAILAFFWGFLFPSILENLQVHESLVLLGARLCVLPGKGEQRPGCIPWGEVLQPGCPGVPDASGTVEPVEEEGSGWGEWGSALAVPTGCLRKLLLAYRNPRTCSFLIVNMYLQLCSSQPGSLMPSFFGMC